MSRRDITKIVFVAIAFSLTTCFFAPAVVYFSNVSEFAGTFGEAAPWLTRNAAVCAVALMAVLFLASRSYEWLLRYHLQGRLVAALLTLTALFWLKGNVFVWDVGIIDGNDIDWTRHAVRGWVEIALWAAAVFFALASPLAVNRRARTVALFLIVVQAASLGLAGMKAPPAQKRYQFDTKDKFVFGSRNVIILVLDSFQTDAFQEIITEDRRYAAMFDGFTYLRNSVGGHPSTTPSVTFLLTGQAFRNERPLPAHIRSAFRSESSIPQRLMRDGFIVDLHPSRRTDVLCDPSVASNALTKKLTRAEVRAETERLYLVTAFRYLPHALQKAIFDGKGKAGKTLESRMLVLGSWDDVQFIKDLSAQARVKKGARVFKFFHVWGGHRPWVMRSDMKISEARTTRDAYKDQLRGALWLPDRLFAKLKDLGVYDDSLILVMGDHGARLEVQIPPNLARKGAPAASVVPAWIKGGGVPVIAVKPFGSRGPVRTSDAPVSLGDVPATIAAELKMDGAFPGLSLLANASPEDRTRHFAGNGSFFVETDYLPQLTAWEVSGFSWLDASWKQVPLAGKEKLAKTPEESL